MNFVEQLSQEKRNYLVGSNGGISLPIAGAVYWLLLSIAGLYLSTKAWGFWAFCTSGLIFPLGLLLSKFVKSDLTYKSSLTNLFLPALLSMMLMFPSAIAAFSIAPELVPLILAIGMSVHWPVITWAYGIVKVGIGHALIRTILVTGIWYLFPEYRLTLLPLTVSLVYIGTVPFFLKEVSKVNRQKS